MLTFDAECQAAVNLAKRAVPEGAVLDVSHLIPALYHGTDLHARLPALAPHIPHIRPVRESLPGTVPLAQPLKPLFRKLIRQAPPVTSLELFQILVDSEDGRQFLGRHGAKDTLLDEALASLEHTSAEPETPVPATVESAGSPFRNSPERTEVMQTLGMFGRLLTDAELSDRNVVEREDTLKTLVKILTRMGRRNAIILGFPGTGKTAVVYELARRIVRGDASIPERLRDSDIFELSPAFLRSGASMVGQYEERVRTLLEVLRRYPKLILFVDEIHSLLQSGVHDRGPFSDANEALKAALGRGEITCIGCTSPAEYRRFIEPDRALVRRFGLVRVDPPSREATINILKARRPRVEAHYAPLRIPDSLLECAVTLTDEYLPALFQPDKSIQLLDAACAACAIAQPPPPAVAEEALMESLADFVGHRVVTSRRLTEASVYETLRSHLLGQDEVIRGIARAFVAGLDPWLRDSGDARPRGVFLFGGPTGVGKTVTALILAEILGGGRESLIRIDCNTLQGSGYDSGPAINRLLGVPPGYVGYARGQGGILSRVRDYPESVVLFDEFEKADPGVGELLLRLLDEGRVEDVDGNLLDFRRTFVTFTTNAGARYQHDPSIGFSKAGTEVPVGQGVAIEDIWADLRAIGLGEEFRNRIPHVFVFRPLDSGAVRCLAVTQLEQLARSFLHHGLEITWDEALLQYLISRWQPHLGARNIRAIVRSTIEERLKVAHMAGELDGITRVHVTAPAVSEATRQVGPEGVDLRRGDEGHTLTLVLGALERTE